MKTAIRRLLILLCLLLAGALLPVWNRSYSRYDRLHWVQWQRDGERVSLRLSGFDLGMGCVQYVVNQMIWTSNPAEIQQMQVAAGRFQPNDRAYRSTRPSRNLIRTNGDSLMAALGFKFREIGRDEISARRVEIALPLWLVFLALLAFPIIHYARGVLYRHKAERQVLNICPRCGEPLPARATHCACCDRPVVVVSEA